MLNVRPIYNSGTKIQYHTHTHTHTHQLVWHQQLEIKRVMTLHDYLYSARLCGSSTLRKVDTGNDTHVQTNFQKQAITQNGRHSVYAFMYLVCLCDPTKRQLTDIL